MALLPPYRDPELRRAFALSPDEQRALLMQMAGEPQTTAKPATSAKPRKRRRRRAQPRAEETTRQIYTQRDLRCLIPWLNAHPEYTRVMLERAREFAGLVEENPDEDDDDLDFIERAARKALHGDPDDPDSIIADGIANGIGTNYSIEAYGAAMVAKIEAMKMRLDDLNDR